MLDTPLGAYGVPSDAAARAALALAVAWLGAALLAPPPLRGVSDRTRVALLAFAASLLSAAYVSVYLRGGPRIVDATSYYLEARTFASGHFTADLPVPSASFRGRFLLTDPGAERLGVIFPPGYPALLALGFLARAPLLVGPTIAAGLVVATYALARRHADDPAVARLAAAFSVVCAALRYHTADTMSHGLAALLVASALVFSWGKSAREPGPLLGAPALATGFCLGWLVATRPATGVVIAAVVVATSRVTLRGLAHTALGAALPISLLLFEQAAVSGRPFESSQLAYYAVADGPPGCFRYGFGRGIGCLFEHGDFVRARLEHGFGLIAAAGTTLRRLKMHLSDAGNVQLFAPVLVLGAVRAFRDERQRRLGWALVAVVLGYVPFYFDGNYPGGGARLFADVLPVEHVLIAAALSGGRLARFAIPAALAGFALHTSHDHRMLADRDGGRPMFEEHVLEQAGVTSGLVFVDTDHGFDLGARMPLAAGRERLVVARRRHDAHDLVLWERLGKPPAFAYEFPLGDALPAVPRVTPLALEPAASFRFEAEAEWPPLAVSGGWAHPDFPSCASRKRALRIHPSGAEVRVRLELPVPRPGAYRVVVGWVGGPTAGAARIQIGSVSIPAASASEGECSASESVRAVLPPDAEDIEIITSSEVQLDYVELRPET